MLTVDSLAVTFQTRNGPVAAVRNISFTLARGEKLGIVGESGSGKSVTSYAVLRILDSGGKITSGEITYNGIKLHTSSEHEMRKLRGREVSMVFQNPRAALNPIRKVGLQIEDALRQHGFAGRWTAKAKAIDSLTAVRIKKPALTYHAYPHELSGGMCQRVVIAIALACNPELLIADEPTTGLDITTEKAVMDLINEITARRRMSAILITHDLALAARYCDRIVVMKDGNVVETNSAAALFKSPQHSYTKKLVSATPRQGVTVRELLPPESQLAAPRIESPNRRLLEVRGLSKVFQGREGSTIAVNNVSFDVDEGQSVGLVGESGCGKSTTSAMIMRLTESSHGEIFFNGTDLNRTSIKGFSRDRRRSALQMVFQDATDSLNPRHTAEQSLLEPLLRLTNKRKTERNERVLELCDLVGLPKTLLKRFPHQLSGGQKARVGIARAIAVEPKLLILDEPTAALDVSIQAVVLNLLVDLRAELGISYLFISHDLRVVQLMCETVLVMQSGEIVERGEIDQVLNSPEHEYTKQLLAAAV